MLLFALLSYVSPVLPLVLFFIYFKRNNKLQLRVVFLYILASFLTNLALSFFENGRTIILHVFTLFEYSFFAFFFYLVIRNRLFRRVIFVLSVIFLVTAIFFIISSAKNKFDSLAASISAILVIVYAIYYFYEQMTDPKMLIIYQSPHFWIATGCLIYLAGTLFLFLFTSEINGNQEDPWWGINNLLDTIKNLFFTIAFVIKRDPSLPQGFEDNGNTNMTEKPF